MPKKCKCKPVKKKVKKRVRKGAGVVDDLKSVGKKVLGAVTSETGAKIRTALSRNPKTRPLFAGEKHAIELSGAYKGSSHNYSGPGTQYAKRKQRGDPPVNKTDAVSMAHDADYYAMRNITDPEELKRREIQADMKAIKGWNAIQGEPEARIASTAIGAKMTAQALGKIPYGVYVDKDDPIGKGRRKRRGRGIDKNVGIALGAVGASVLAKKAYDAYKKYKDIEKQVKNVKTFY